MKIRDRLEISFRNLWRRKSRTILTILSVLIGSVSIIMMLALALTMTKQQRSMVESLGGLENIEISQSQKNSSFTSADVNKFKNVDHVKYVIPHKDIYLDVFLKNKEDIKLQSNYGIRLIPDKIFSKITKDMIESGTSLRKSDENTMLLGNECKIYNFKKSRDGSYNPEEMEMDYKTSKFILRIGYKDESTNPNFGEDPSSNKPSFADVEMTIKGKMNKNSFLEGKCIYINEKTYKNLEKEDKKLENSSLQDSLSPSGKINKNFPYNAITVTCDKYESVKEVEDKIRSMGYDTNSYISMIEEINKSTRIIMGILGGIGSIAFFVAAIGIINTMLMSIYERQKEIGLMKVIGASISDIRSMFLLESGFIGFFGGLLGLLISLLLGIVVNYFLRGFFGAEMGEDAIKFTIPIWLAVLGVAFSSLVGVLAGYLPAKRATKLSAIETLRSN